LTVVGAHHTGLHVADLQRSLGFYRDLLGLEVVWERVVDEEYVRRIVGLPEAELHQAMLRIPGSEHHLELIDYRGVTRRAVDPAPPTVGTAHVCLHVSSLGALHRRLVEAGVVGLSEPQEVPVGPNVGATAVYMRDPDGFCVELVEPA
jgi:lactoylglutathione lyase